MVERRAYVVLVSISVILSTLVLLVCLKIVSENHAKICGLLAIIASKEVARPVNPAGHPIQYAEYQRHLRYVQLSEECH